MLRGMRKASSNWLGRTVMGTVLGLIAVSFAIWGVGDIFRGFGRSTVAKIGSTEITVEQFRQIYNDRLQQLGRQIGRPITPDQARMLRLDQQVLAQLIGDTALDLRARQLRLNLSDQEVARLIMEDSNFKGPNGQFERARFDSLIRNAGYTEQRYTAEIRRQTLRRELTDSVAGELSTPKAVIEALNRYENEQRAIDYINLDRSKAGDIEAPTPEILAKYFDENKVRFRAPEYRSVVYLTLTPAELAKPGEISDADAKAYYDANTTRFGTPERRQVLQIVFPNAEEAAAAAARLEKGEITFAALATERGLTEKDIDLGLMTKSAIIDRAIADAAFALKEGAVSAPIQGRFGSTLVSASKIEPPNVKPFEEVAGEIKQTLALERARARMGELQDKIEDERASGQRLTEIGQKLNLPVRTIEVDRQGRDPAGKPIEGLPAGTDVIGSAFASDIGVENDPLQLQGGGYLWYDVAAVKPGRERTLDEVRDEVETRWREDQVAERLKAKANEILAKLKAGTSFADAAASAGVPVQTTFGLKRSGNTQQIAQRVINAVFAVPKDGVGASEAASPTDWVVFHVTDIAAPAFNADSPETKRISDNMRRSLMEDLLNQYILRLQADFGATINQDALRRVASGSTDQN